MYCVTPIKESKKFIKGIIYPVNLKLVNTPLTEKIWEEAEIYWGNRIDHLIIDKMKNLRWIHFGSVGINRINNIQRKDLIITSSKGLVTSAMTTNIISLIGLFSRNLQVFFNREKKSQTLEKNLKNTFIL